MLKTIRTGFAVNLSGSTPASAHREFKKVLGAIAKGVTLVSPEDRQYVRDAKLANRVAALRGNLGDASQGVATDLR